MPRWYRFAQKTKSNKTTWARRRITPVWLESLEDRLAPATFNVGTLADGGPGSLRAAILSSNATAGPNTINLTLAGTYKLTLFGNAHDGTNGALQINNQSVTIANTSGGTAIIDGGGVDRVFDIEGSIAGGVTFSGITIRGGLAGANSNSGGDANGKNGDGGGIYSPLTSVTLNNCVITSNMASAGGGAIWTDTANVTLSASTISGNNAASAGGGIYSKSGTIALTSSTVSDNVAAHYGGGIYDETGSISVSSTTVTGNAANSAGGGMGTGYSSTGTLTISSSIITDNVSGNAGGGVWETSESGTATVTTSTISGNTAGSAGGGLYLSSATASITGCTISGNEAYGPAGGGGIYAGRNSSQVLTISRSTINDNTVSNLGGGGGGGGIHANSQTMTLTGCTISGNTASNGGGVVFYGTGMNVGNCTITGNSAEIEAGGIEMANPGNNTSFKLTGSAVSDNRAGRAEAGIRLLMMGAGSSVTISNSAIDANQCASAPGGLNVSCTTLTITSSSFNNNRSSNEAGINANVTTAILTNVNVIGNHSGGEVGGVYLSDTTLTMTGCNISDNLAGFSAAGINASGTATISNTTISGNSAGDSDGGLQFSGTSLTLNNDTITNNTSGSQAGGAFIGVSAGGSINQCTITGNSAALSGGGLQTANSSAGTPLTITGCNISNNHSGFDGGGISDASSGAAGLSLTNDTLFGNTAAVNGGAIAFEGSSPATVDFVTVDRNSAANGGGLYQHGPTINVHNSITASNAANAAHGPDVNGAFVSLGHNLIGVKDAASTGFTNGTLNDQVGSVGSPINPMLGPLENNGGPTFTQRLMPGSSAIDAADITNAPPTDQRGFPRPGMGQSAPSIGAFEPQVPAVLGNTANGVMVESLYETLLGRAADPGAAGWVTALNNGTKVASLVIGIESSAEYLTKEVQGLYRTYLLRAADAGGLQHFVSFLAAGGTIEQAAEAIVSSPEYFQLCGGSNDALLNALYCNALCRGGSPAEQAGFLQALDSGTATAGQIAAEVFSSPEYQADQVRSFFESYLGRTPDRSGLAFWTSQLQSGATDTAVQAGILGSAEAFVNRS